MGERSPHSPTPASHTDSHGGVTVFALMVGTLQVSRALADQRLADEVLEEGIQNALALLGADHHG
jgi:homoaconitase/3-isopropylmalate dehydratase large subunit